MTSVPAAAFFDLTRTASALAGMADQAGIALEGRALRNLPRALKNERFQINMVIDAARSSPAGFTGAQDVTGGIELLERAVARIDSARAKIEQVADGLRGAGDVSAAVPDAAGAADDVARGHALLGGTRELPPFEGVGSGLVDDASLQISPADNRFVAGRGHPGLQRGIQRIVGAGIDRALGHRVDGLEHVPQSGRVIIAPSHGAWADPVHNAIGLTRPVRFMANEKVLTGVLAKPLTAAGAFPVRHGDAAEGMAVARGVLATDQAMVMYPGAMINKGDFYDAHRDGVAILGLEMQAPIVPGASYGSRPAVFRGESAARRPLVSMRYGPAIETRGVPRTEFNTQILRERIAREQARLMDDSRAEYVARREASQARRPYWLAAGAASAITGSGLVAGAALDE
jgi:1-acyl-sn-glycerol-3-phosphate acyltransferase